MLFISTWADLRIESNHLYSTASAKSTVVGHPEVILRTPARAGSCQGELGQPFPMADR